MWSEMRNEMIKVKRRATKSLRITTTVEIFSASFNPSTVRMPTAGVQQIERNHLRKRSQ